MIVYKVVRKLVPSRLTEDDKFTSLVITEYGLRLEYEVGKTTVPFIGRVFAFATLIQARDFAYNRIILKCRTPYKHPLKRCVHFSQPNEVVAFWLGEDTSTLLTVRGTVGCDEVTPIEVVK